jgi:hypothetical protein
MTKLTFEQKRLAVICFNHVQSQWVWHMGRLILDKHGRGEARTFIKKECKWFGHMAPPPSCVHVQADEKGTAMVLRRQEREVARLTWNEFVDFMEQYPFCPRSTAEIDEEELMSVF